MRLFLGLYLLLAFSMMAVAQGTPPPDSVQMVRNQSGEQAPQGGPPADPAQTRIQQVKRLVKRELRKAVDGRPYPAIENWRPLTTHEKLDVFLKHTYAPGTFARAGIDAVKCEFKTKNSEYERGWRGLGQHAGIELATSESDIFFQQFLIPSLLKQDPRYFRNPNMAVLPRVFYSMSRVVITRANDGHETFNASKIIGGSISQALGDLYVPGQRQGMDPILGRITFNLARDAGFNLVHEFWPDLRRKFGRSRLFDAFR